MARAHIRKQVGTPFVPMKWLGRWSELGQWKQKAEDIFAPNWETCKEMISWVEELVAISKQEPARDISMQVSEEARMGELLTDIVGAIYDPATCLHLVRHSSYDCLTRALTSWREVERKIRIWPEELRITAEELATTLAVFGLCRKIFDLSERIAEALKSQPWALSGGPGIQVTGNRDTFLDPEPGPRDQLFNLVFHAARYLNALTGYMLKGSEAINFIGTMQIPTRVALVLEVVEIRQGPLGELYYRDFLDATAGFISVMCLTKGGYEVLLQAIAEETFTKAWYNSLNRYIPSGGSRPGGTSFGGGFLAWAYEAGLSVDSAADGNDISKVLYDAADASESLKYDSGRKIKPYYSLKDPPAGFFLAKPLPNAEGSVVYDSLNVLREATLAFSRMYRISRDLRLTNGQGCLSYNEEISRNASLDHLYREMVFVSEMLGRAHTRQSVYLAARHIGGLDYICKIALGQPTEEHAGVFRDDASEIYKIAVLIHRRLMEVSMSYEPLLSLHTGEDKLFSPALILQLEVSLYLSDMDLQVRLLSEFFDSPALVDEDKDFLECFQASLKAMTTKSLQTTNYLARFTACFTKKRNNMSVLSMLVIALNKLVNKSFGEALQHPSAFAPNYYPAHEPCWKAFVPSKHRFPFPHQVTPIARLPYVEWERRDPQSQRLPATSGITSLRESESIFQTQRRLDNLMSCVCSLAVIVRRYVKSYWGNARAGMEGICADGDHMATDKYWAERREQPNNDPFKDFSRAHAIIEAFLNGLSMCADIQNFHASVHPMVWLVAHTCRSSLDTLLEGSRNFSPSGPVTYFPKYLGKDVGIALVVMILSDVVKRKRVQAIGCYINVFDRVLPQGLAKYPPRLFDRGRVADPKLLWWMDQLEACPKKELSQFASLMRLRPEIGKPVYDTLIRLVAIDPVDFSAPIDIFRDLENRMAETAVQTNSQSLQWQAENRELSEPLDALRAYNHGEYMAEAKLAHERRVAEAKEWQEDSAHDQEQAGFDRAVIRHRYRIRQSRVRRKLAELKERKSLERKRNGENPPERPKAAGRQRWVKTQRMLGPRPRVFNYYASFTPPPPILTDGRLGSGQFSASREACRIPIPPPALPGNRPGVMVFRRQVLAPQTDLSSSGCSNYQAGAQGGGANGTRFQEQKETRPAKLDGGVEGAERGYRSEGTHQTGAQRGWSERGGHQRLGSTHHGEVQARINGRGEFQQPGTHRGGAHQTGEQGGWTDVEGFKHFGTIDQASAQQGSNRDGGGSGGGFQQSGGSHHGGIQEDWTGKGRFDQHWSAHNGGVNQTGAQRVGAWRGGFQQSGGFHRGGTVGRGVQQFGGTHRVGEQWEGFHYPGTAQQTSGATATRDPHNQSIAQIPTSVPDIPANGQGVNANRGSPIPQKWTTPTRTGNRGNYGTNRGSTFGGQSGGHFGGDRGVMGGGYRRTTQPAEFATAKGTNSANWRYTGTAEKHY